MNEKGFFGSLFDLSFSNFITTKIIRFLYGLLIFFSGIAALALIVKGFSMGFWRGIGSLIISPLLFILYVVVARIWLELVIVIFRIAEHIAEINAFIKEKKG
jgi:hypothetical protein